MADYSATERLLHRLALNYPSLSEALFDLESGLNKVSAPAVRGGQHVFVSGLARAGTTVLMRHIHGSGAFASLTYADMPFVMCPNLWRRIAGRFPKRLSARERAHGDGVIVGGDSPEAFDEVFWRIFCAEDYIRGDGLYPHQPSEEIAEKFVLFVGHVLLKEGKARYLSKNNNNTLRLASLAQLFPEATFLVPIREPAAQALSLLAQHKRFLDADRFTAAYMAWLGHHEFGATHKRFVLAETSAPTHDPMSADYWLAQWLSCYDYLARLGGEIGGRVVFVPYERFCDDQAFRSALAARIGIAGFDASGLRPSADAQVAEADPALLARARSLYATIADSSHAALGA